MHTILLLKDTGWAIFARSSYRARKKHALRTSMSGGRAMDHNLQFKLGSVGGLDRAFSSYQLKTNLKNNSDCLFGPTIA